MSEPTTIRMIFPQGHLGFYSDEDTLTTALRLISVAFGSAGEWCEKDGCAYENDVFLMHPFCWCEEAWCLWCGADCGCPKETMEYFFDGERLKDRNEWKAINDRFFEKIPHHKGSKAYYAEHEGRAAERNRRLTHFYGARQHVCEPRGLLTDRERSQDWRPRQSAPHFWFKPSGFKVWWYKYIGRDMEIHGEPTDDLMARVFASHPTGMTVDDALAELSRRTDDTRRQWSAMMATLNASR